MATYKRTAIDLTKLEAVRFKPKKAPRVAVTKVFFKSKNSAEYSCIWTATKNLVILKYGVPDGQGKITVAYEFTEGMTWAELATLHPDKLIVDPRGRVVFAELGEIGEDGMPEILSPFTYWVTLDGYNPVNGTDTVTGTETLMARTI